MTKNRAQPRLQIELETQHCELSAAEIRSMEEKLEPLHEHAAHFPVSDLHISITFHKHTNSYRVNFALLLSGRTLTTVATTDSVSSGVVECVERMVRRILQYKSELSDTSEREKYRKGTRHDVLPNREVDGEAVRKARKENDYVAFRRELYTYEDTLQDRVGRWIERYPTLTRELGARWTLADFVEEVFLTAYDEFDAWPEHVRLGQWLEDLIPKSLDAILKDPDGELANIGFVQTAEEAQTERES